MNAPDGTARPEVGTPSTSPATVHRTLDCVAASVPAARRFVAAALVGMPPEIGQTAALLISELATNCVIHAATDFAVEVTVGHGEIRVKVTDHGPGMPAIANPSPTNPHGRGLQFVDTLSSAWGSAITPSGSKTTWFTLTVPD